MTAASLVSFINSVVPKVHVFVNERHNRVSACLARQNLQGDVTTFVSVVVCGVGVRLDWWHDECHPTKHKKKEFDVRWSAELFE